VRHGHIRASAIAPFGQTNFKRRIDNWICDQPRAGDLEYAEDTFTGGNREYHTYFVLFSSSSARWCGVRLWRIISSRGNDGFFPAALSWRGHPSGSAWPSHHERPLVRLCRHGQQLHVDAGYSWNMPSVSYAPGGSGGGAEQTSSTWIGIGGNGPNDDTLVQLGTLQQVNSSSGTKYYA
jgi:hypothetical protein